MAIQQSVNQFLTLGATAAGATMYGLRKETERLEEGAKALSAQTAAKQGKAVEDVFTEVEEGQAKVEEYEGAEQARQQESYKQAQAAEAHQIEQTLKKPLGHYLGAKGYAKQQKEYLGKATEPIEEGRIEGYGQWRQAQIEAMQPQEVRPTPAPTHKEIATQKATQAKMEALAKRERELQRQRQTEALEISKAVKAYYGGKQQ